MYQHFSSDFFRGNRERLRTLFTGSAPIVLTAHGLLQQSNDTAYTFHQDANFWYLTGIEDPDVVLVMDKHKEYLIVPEQDWVKEAFDGEVNYEQLTATSGIETVLPAKEGWRQLGARLKRVKHVATMAAPPAYVDFYGFYTNPARTVLIERIKQINPDIELLNVRQHFEHMRMVKQAPELAAIERAVDITVKTLKAISKKGYARENEYEGEITARFRKAGADGYAYDPIVATGYHACTMHHFKNNGVIGPSDLVLIDVGASVEHYGADVSRTFAFSNKPTKRQRAVHDAVLQVHEYVLSYLKPGMTLRESEKLSEHFMGEKLRELGLIKTIEKEAVRKLFPHATSHFLGLDTHDLGDYDRPLEPGMVLTVEPGIYIPDESIGVRLEDDILITSEGIKNLSATLPYELC
jgi:Xaa-Pro aminopeptidase